MKPTVRCPLSRDFNATPKTSRIMACIKSQDTRPELVLRKHLWRMGSRGYRIKSKLPGRPDICFSSVKLVVFIDGCFWHGCPVHFRLPKKNTEYWSAKIAGNITRDRNNGLILESLGFKVVRVWEHLVKSDPAQAASIVMDEVCRRRQELNSCR